MAHDIITDGEFYPAAEPFDAASEYNQKTDAENKTDQIADALNTDPEAFLNVSRQTQGGNSPMEFVGRFPADKFDYAQLQAYLQSNFGGGDYRVMLYAKGKLRANRLLTIATPVKSSGTELNQNSALSMVVNKMAEMQDQMTRVLQANIAPQTSRMEMMRELMMMKEIFGNNSAPATDPFQMLRQVIDLKNELGIGDNNAEREPGFGDLLEKLTPLVTAVAANTPTNKAENETQKKPQTDKEKAAANMRYELETIFKMLIKGATKNSDPASYAEMVLDNLNPNLVNGVLLQPGAVEKLKVLKPEVKNYEPWFHLLLEHIKANLGMPSKVSDLYDSDEGVTVDASDENGSGSDDDLPKPDNQ